MSGIRVHDRERVRSATVKHLLFSGIGASSPHEVILLNRRIGLILNLDMYNDKSSYSHQIRKLVGHWLGGLMVVSVAVGGS